MLRRRTTQGQPAGGGALEKLSECGGKVEYPEMLVSFASDLEQLRDIKLSNTGILFPKPIC